MSIFKDKYKQLKRILCFIFIFMVCFQCIMPSEVVYAKIGGHDTYVIQPRLNGDGTYSAKPVQSSVTFGKGLEEKNSLNFGEVFKNDYSKIDISEDVSEDFGKYLYFSFPSHDAYKGFDNNYNNTSGDYSRAGEIAALINELNRLIKTIDRIDGDINIVSAEKSIAATKELTTLPNGTYLKNPNDISTIGNTPVTVSLGNVGTVFYCYYNSDSSWEGIYYDTFGNHETNKDIKLKMYFTSKTGQNVNFDVNDIDTYQSFYWAQLKGYLSPDGKLKNQASKASEINGQSYLDGLSSTNISPLGDSLNENSGDNAWITIFDMATVANYYYVAEGVSTDDTANEASWIERLIFNIVSSFALTLKSILGLSDITELIYSNENSLSGGTMDNTWWSIMLKYHLIFQVIAWLLVGLAVAKLLLELNFSSVQPNVKVSIFETLQKIFVVGFLLALAVPIIRLMTDVNVAFVDIFKTQAPNNDVDMFTIGDTLAQAFAYFSYIGILLMINCTYIMRSIMIAIFGASAPLFIVSMLFSKGKGMFDNWLKEMAANIFLQSVHAFAFAFLFAVIDVSALLPKLVVFWSLMPITEQFRGFIFGSSGGFTTKQGNAMGSFIQKQATANARNAASTTSAIAGKNIQNSNPGKRLGLKSAEETGNATGVGGGGSKSGRGGKTTSSNAGADVMKDAAQQMAEKGEHKKLATFVAGAGHALSAGGQIGGQAMDMMDAMTDIQMQNFEGAGRSLDSVRSAGSNMAVSAADYAGQGVNKAITAGAKRALKFSNKIASPETREMANTYRSGTKEAKKSINENKSLKQKLHAGINSGLMKRCDFSSIDENGNGIANSGSFVGGNGHTYATVDSNTLNDGVNTKDVWKGNESNIKSQFMTEEFAIKGKDTNGKEIVTGYQIPGYGKLSADGTKLFKENGFEASKYTNNGKTLAIDTNSETNAVYAAMSNARKERNNNSSQTHTQGQTQGKGQIVDVNGNPIHS